ncbi:grainyhead-like [Apophysomyces ossiformis]|uniref:Grainyhead-like n=1 Tax=Apophysomyces ossiformis TaxID=679940 RepID=A0A8H7BL30_9FUNG|nr:grainyhead-like [Apophysomyces ossiformis]
MLVNPFPPQFVDGAFSDYTHDKQTTPPLISPTESPSALMIDPNMTYSPPSQPPPMMSIAPSPTSASPPPASHSRFHIVLEAQTAATQRPDEPPLTYLNKGQYYNITFTDSERRDEILTSTIVIMFHDESHRKAAPNYWKFWLSQQKSAQNARAIEIDFSRIKGVKGIPLRLHVETQQLEQQVLEKTFCRIKLFRDKGAERKNKDDAKHIERQMEKLQNKQGSTHPLWATLYRSQPQTVFCEIPSSPPMEINRDLHRCSITSTSSTSSMASNTSNTSQPPLPLHTYSPSMCPPPPPPVIVPSTIDTTLNTSPTNTPTVQNGVKRPYPYWVNHNNVLDLDATYVPRQRQRIARLCLFVRFESDHLYRAIYLDQLTVQDLIEKLATKMDLTRPVAKVVRCVASKGVIVSVDDAFVQDIQEEQDMVIETEVNEEGDVNLILRY